MNWGSYVVVSLILLSTLSVAVSADGLSIQYPFISMLSFVVFIVIVLGVLILCDFGSRLGVSIIMLLLVLFWGLYYLVLGEAFAVIALVFGWGVIFAGLAWGGSIAKVYKVETMNPWRKRGYFAVLTISLLISQIGIFGNFEAKRPPMTATGFQHIRPQLATTEFTHDGNFSSVFVNTLDMTWDYEKGGIVRDVGHGIVIKDGVNITNIGDWRNMSESCSSYSVKPSRMIPAGGEFTIEARGCIEDVKGGVYQIRVLIPYEVTVNGYTTQHNESGTIRSFFL